MWTRIVVAAALFVGACGESARTTEMGEQTKASQPAQMWAKAERASRHTCPSDQCGVVGQLLFRESARVHEIKDGWARVTDPYDASCANGASAYVDHGNKACTAANGVVEGRFAEWVRLDQLSETRPADPAETATLNERLVADSDDFGRHRTAFMKAASQLIADGRCSARDFEEMGGWVKSTNHADAPVYFTYCGGMTISNRIYLNAATGRLYRE